MKIKNIVPILGVAGCSDKDRKYTISAICLKCPVKIKGITNPESILMMTFKSSSSQLYFNLDNRFLMFY